MSRHCVHSPRRLRVVLGGRDDAIGQERGPSHSDTWRPRPGSVLGPLGQDALHETRLGHKVRYAGSYTGWFRLNAQNCVPGNSSRRFFELDHEILHTYSGRQYLKLEEGVFLFGVSLSRYPGFDPPRVKYSSRDPE